LKQAPYAGQPIAMVALFEKGILRADIVALLTELRRQNIYILAVNTLKLQKDSPEIALFDTYVEIFNFGRDFGMYKFAFTYLFKMGWTKSCPRLLMVNDSIFFSSRGLAQFIADMMASDKDALGATENFEIEHHLGSFCISFSNFTLNHKRFKSFWNNYRRMDVRPKVIKGGEMGLSKALKKIVRHQAAFGALYDVNLLKTFINEVDHIRSSLDNVRVSDLVHWRRTSLLEIIARFQKQYGLAPSEHIEFEVQNPSPELLMRTNLLVTSLDTMLSAIESQNLTGTNLFFDRLLGFVRNELIYSFISGSQIHQNAAILILMGLPIVKMDGLYRGTFVTADVLTISKLLPDDEARALISNLMLRPYGSDTLVGWKKAAFMRGLL